MSESDVDEMSFEAAMAELEQVVTQLERGEVPLEESIKLYERGALLRKRCEKKLKEAEDLPVAKAAVAKARTTEARPMSVNGDRPAASASGVEAAGRHSPCAGAVWPSLHDSLLERQRRAGGYLHYGAEHSCNFFVS